MLTIRQSGSRCSAAAARVPSSASPTITRSSSRATISRISSRSRNGIPTSNTRRWRSTGRSSSGAGEEKMDRRIPLRSRRESGSRGRKGLVPQRNSGVAKARGGLGPAVDTELLQDPVDVVLHGRKLDLELKGDLLVRQATFEEPSDLQLARREHRHEPVVGAASRGADPAQERRGGPGRAGELPLGGADDRADEIVERSVARDETGDAGLGPGHYVGVRL